MTSKVMIGLASAAIFSVATTMSASAQRITAQIPKRTCEMVTVDTQNWGKQTIQVCEQLGGPLAKPLDYFVVECLPSSSNPAERTAPNSPARAAGEFV
jgi:hypothetical protein